MIVHAPNSPNSLSLTQISPIYSNHVHVQILFKGSCEIKAFYLCTPDVTAHPAIGVVSAAKTSRIKLVLPLTLSTIFQVILLEGHIS